MKRAAEWFLTLREIPLERAHELITEQAIARPEDGAVAGVEHDEPVLYDTGLDASEGYWLRQGWAGRG